MPSDPALTSHRQADRRRPHCLQFERDLISPSAVLERPLIRTAANYAFPTLADSFLFSGLLFHRELVYKTCSTAFAANFRKPGVCGKNKSTRDDFEQLKRSGYFEQEISIPDHTIKGVEGYLDQGQMTLSLAHLEPTELMSQAGKRRGRLADPILTKTKFKIREGETKKRNASRASIPRTCKRQRTAANSKKIIGHKAKTDSSEDGSSVNYITSRQGIVVSSDNDDEMDENVKKSEEVENDDEDGASLTVVRNTTHSRREHAQTTEKPLFPIEQSNCLSLDRSKSASESHSGHPLNHVQDDLIHVDSDQMQELQHLCLDLEVAKTGVENTRGLIQEKTADPEMSRDRCDVVASQKVGKS